MADKVLLNEVCENFTNYFVINFHTKDTRNKNTLLKENCTPKNWFTSFFLLQTLLNFLYSLVSEAYQGTPPPFPHNNCS